VVVDFHIVRCASSDAKVSNKTNGLRYLENRHKILRTLYLCLIGTMWMERNSQAFDRNDNPIHAQDQI
jgi:hypothetical protein